MTPKSDRIHLAPEPEDEPEPKGTPMAHAFVIKYVKLHRGKWEPEKYASHAEELSSERHLIRRIEHRKWADYGLNPC